MSEKNKNKTTNKWLVSRLKTSGSKRERVESLDYSESRNSKSNVDIEELPTHESMSKNVQFYNGKINTDLLKRFLRTQIGRKWDDVYSEIIERIPSKLQDYKYCVYWYVADKIEIREDKLWNLRDNFFIIQKNEELNSHWSENYRHMDFYVDPNTKELCKINDFESRRLTKGLNIKELRQFRENENVNNLIRRRSKKKSGKEVEEIEEILKGRNKITFEEPLMVIKK